VPTTSLTAHSTSSSHGELAEHLRHAVARLHRKLRQQDQSGLGPTVTAALATVARQGDPTLGELAAFENVTPPTMTAVVTKLEALGLVARHTDDQDRRVIRVRLTDAGRNQLEDVRTRRTAWLDRQLQLLTPGERATLADAAGLLARLAEIGSGTSAQTESDPTVPGAASEPNAPGSVAP
jgi:DNA-binding MarR family transcriptional regulator